jgi:hypothetical protein
MLVGVAMICVLLTIMVAIGMAWALGLMLLVLLILAHILGNALGTQLRDGGIQPPESSGSELPLTAGKNAQFQQNSTWEPPRAGRMQAKLPVGWPMLALTAIGAVSGGALGGLVIHSLYQDHITALAIFIASLASGIMGGMAVFLTATFIDMAHRVWQEATRDASPPTSTASKLKGGH